MKNILYYVKKYGNDDFDRRPFNEVDGLILSQISYLNLDEFVPDINQNLEAIELLNNLDKEKIYKLAVDTLDQKRNTKLLKLLAKSTRYGKLKCNYFSNRFLVDKVEQFCAVTFIFKEFIFIAYRGTDLSLLGWHEDFNMSLLDVIPAQEDATKYLNKVSNLIDKSIYVGGHSKGGNLAVYAALYGSEAIKKRIIKIYDYDGPGFQIDIFNSKEYLDIQSKIYKSTCKEAMIGILLHHSEKMTFIDSRGISIFHHDPYNWKIKRNGQFKLIKKQNLISRAFEKSVNSFLEVTSLEERKLFLEIIFDVIMEKPTSTLLDIKRRPIKYLRGIYKRYKSLTTKQTKLFKKLLKRFRLIFRHSVKNYLKRRLNFANKST